MLVDSQAIAQNIVIALRWFMLASGIVLGAGIFLSDVPSFKDKAYFFSRYISFKRVVVVFGTLLFFSLVMETGIRSWLQYQAFSAGGPGQYLLPPHTPITYFLGYAAFHFVLWRVLALVVGVLLFAALWRRLPKSQWLQARINLPEAFLLSFGVAASGWPFLLVYLFGVAVLYSLILTALTLWATMRRATEMPRFPLVLPLMVALVPALPFGNALIEALNFGVLRISIFSI